MKCFLTLCVLACLAPTGLAHEFGAMRLHAEFRADGVYIIDAVIDPEHLPADARAAAAKAREPGQVEELERAFLRAAALRFDGARVDPRFEPVLPDPSRPADVIALRFAGMIPDGARTVTWSHMWPKGQYFLRLGNEGDGEAVVEWMVGDATSAPFPLRAPAPRLSTADVAGEYLVLGFTHIVPKGLDHILFVLGLFLLSMKVRPILAQVTAFTAAHSITLALSIYGVVRLPSSVVEPLIALSIAFVAIENICVRRCTPRRTLLVFAFGLLHGLGFAGVLSELGLPRVQFVPALVAFNLGVEAGQLAVIACAWAAVGLWFGRRDWYRARVTVPASCAIALVGVYWTAERLGA